MTTPGNPLSLLTVPPAPGARSEKRISVGRIGRWTVYEVKQGGMGDIYICGVEDSPPEFALKSFQPRLFFDSESRDAFLREVTVWLRLTGTPFITPTLGIEEHEGRLFVLMPAVEEDQRGVGTVGDLITRKVASPVEAFTVAWRLAAGMMLAGDAIPGVSHGDLKPSNVLYNGASPMISDFGLASIGRADGRSLRATPGYEAPEYATTGPTPSADIYAYGVIISELAASCAGQETFFSGGESEPDSIVQALREMGEKCRVLDSALRPSFAEVVKKLASVVLDHPAELRPMFMQTAMLHSLFGKLKATLLPQVATGLLKINAPRHALEMLDSIQHEPPGGKVSVLKGTSLSLLNRDSEALTWFEKALNGPLDERERVNCLSEYALSLKRVGRLKEAETIYFGLLGKVPDSQLGQVAVNLASVYAEGGRHQEAAELMVRFIHTHQDVPLAFAALANSYAAMGRYPDAAAQYQRALSLAPQRADLQVAFARICLEHLGRWEDADAALFAAHQQGFISREWLLLAIVCSMVTRRTRDLDSLMAAAQRDLPVDEFKRLEKEAFDLTLAVLRQAVGPENPGQGKAEAETVERVNPPQEEPNERGEPPYEAPAGGNPNVTSPESFEPAGLPFFNVRFYVSENRFSFDFYNDLGLPDYEKQFLESWNHFQRDPRLNHNAQLRPTPLYFHQCPNCDTYILTNRDEGKALSCRQCNVKNPTRKIQTQKTNEVLEVVHKALGKSLKSSKGLTQFVMFQPVEDNRKLLDEMKQICNVAGFEHFAEANSPLWHLCLMSLKKRGVEFDERREIVTVTKVSISDELSYEGDATPETDSLIRRLLEVGPMRSMSITYDPGGKDWMSLFLAGNREEMERRCRQAVGESPEDMALLRLLITILRANKKTAEAKSFALRATVLAPNDPDSWESLGEVERDREEYEAAILHLRKAIGLDPRQRGALVNLFVCYEKTGDTEKAEEIRGRIQALGGPMLFE